MDPTYPKFTIFSKSIKNQGLSFQHHSRPWLSKEFNGSDLANGAHRNKILIFYYPALFANISKSMTDKRLKFDITAILDLVIRINCSDLDCGTQIIRFQNKNGNLQVSNAFVDLKIPSTAGMFFAIFPSSMMNHTTKFPIAVLGPSKDWMILI
eukprot:TRINITY_DN4621_c2_g1_i1.p1 TRINITY_DN4621_c2_g1~~TRINITY_DN4621_c2_g1_i1.p1  ORF type:complete len:153 (-),score=7.17 TRINITY_DN4621_c2_g1_i1:713-1171(-)